MKNYTSLADQLLYPGFKAFKDFIALFCPQVEHRVFFPPPKSSDWITIQNALLFPNRDFMFIWWTRLTFKVSLRWTMLYISKLVLTHVPHSAYAPFNRLALGYVHGQAQVWYAYVTWGEENGAEQWAVSVHDKHRDVITCLILHVPQMSSSVWVIQFIARISTRRGGRKIPRMHLYPLWNRICDLLATWITENEFKRAVIYRYKIPFLTEYLASR